MAPGRDLDCKISPVGTGRLIAMVGVGDAAAKDAGTLQILLVGARNYAMHKNELPATRIHRQCNPKAIEVAFLSVPAIEFFAEEQYQALQDWYSALGQGLEPIDATVRLIEAPARYVSPAQPLDVWVHQAH